MKINRKFLKDTWKLFKWHIIVTLLIVLTAIAFILFAVYWKGKLFTDYQTAIEMIDDGNYDLAIEILEELGDDYRDVPKYLDTAKKEKAYHYAIELYEEGMNDYALEQFVQLGYYKDSRDYRDKVILSLAKHISINLYFDATHDYANGKYEEALEKFYLIPDYDDSMEYIEACEEKLNKK